MSNQQGGVLILSTVDPYSQLIITPKVRRLPLTSQWCLSLVSTSCQATSFSVGANGAEVTLYYYDLLRESVFDHKLEVYRALVG